MTSPFAILWPAFALAAWTLCVLLLVAARRVAAGLSGKVHPREYTLGESAQVPAALSLPNRNYMNLLELPVLFYAICLIGQITQVADPRAVALAWAYVALRMVHTVIHVTYNHVMHRFAAFAASNGVLVLLWASVGLAMAGRS